MKKFLINLKQLLFKNLHQLFIIFFIIVITLSYAITFKYQQINNERIHKIYMSIQYIKNIVNASVISRNQEFKNYTIVNQKYYNEKIDENIEILKEYAKLHPQKQENILKIIDMLNNDKILKNKILVNFNINSKQINGQF